MSIKSTLLIWLESKTVFFRFLRADSVASTLPDQSFLNASHILESPLELKKFTNAHDFSQKFFVYYSGDKALI